MSRRGGERAGAGRKPMFNMSTVMALHYRVKELQREHRNLSKKAALRIMQSRKEIPVGPLDNYLRYLTPKSLGVGIRYGLSLLTKRAGIAATVQIPPSLKYTPRKTASDQLEKRKTII